MTIDTVRRIEQFTPLVLNVYKSCGIRELPFDCFSLLCRCGFDLRQYKNLPEEKRMKLMKVSPDAAIIKNSIFYNESQGNTRRMRFSLMHEMGHNITCSLDDADADLFASIILAPPQLIYRLGLKTADEISKRFNISVSAANRALYIAKSFPALHKQTEVDRELLSWFGFESLKVVPQIVPEQKQPKRLPPLISKGEKEKWSPEQQKAIASIRRKRRKIAKAMDGVEGTSNMVIEFGLLEHELEYRRLGGGL